VSSSICIVDVYEMSNFNLRNVRERNEREKKGKSMSDVVDAPLIALDGALQTMKIVEFRGLGSRSEAYRVAYLNNTMRVNYAG
jgi:hypothetical protein